MLATQNPVDLDYKALSNTGTWFLGRLQTERDKMRVLDGLEGAAIAGQKQFNRQTLDQTLSGLGNRIFLMNNVHEDVPVVFETRWAMSYLRGPLTRDQIKFLIDPTKKQNPTTTAALKPTAPSLRSSTSPDKSKRATGKPIVPPDVPEYFLPEKNSTQKADNFTYTPMIAGFAQVRYYEAKEKIDVTTELAYLTPIRDNPLPVNWEDAEEKDLEISDLQKEPAVDFPFTELPSAALKSKNYAVWKKDFSDWLFRTQKLQLFRSPCLNELSKPGELESDFRIRLQQTAREKRDQQVTKLREKYSVTFTRLDERIRRAKIVLDEQKSQAKGQKYQVMASIGETILGSFLGRKSSSRATRATREITRSMKESRDRENAEKNLDVLQKERAKLEAAFQSEAAHMETKMNPLVEKLENFAVSPSRTNVKVQIVALVWTAR
jgi:hypothetical protein